MQYEERKIKPESTRKYLVQQVQEQSDLCDVTVKMGHWEKRFHRCVLVSSPFFENVLKNNFLEAQTGMIEMKLGTPVTIETAIMFLYGKRPKLTQDNIEHVLNLAEFLLIPNLKSACISWLKTATITDENCITLLQLSSIYDFEIPKCNEYIEGHLYEMLRHKEMVNLTNDSVHFLFSDRKFSYVSMDDKLTFLLRWRDSQPEQRRVAFKELLATIDFNEVSKTLLQEIKEDLSLKESIDFERVLGNLDNNFNTHRVLIMKSESSEGSFWCLDLERDKWFRLDSTAYEEKRSYRFNEIAGKGSTEFEIYFIDKGYQQSEILTLNLQSDTCRKFKIVNKESGEDFKQFDDLQMHGDTCIFNVNERVKTNKPNSKTVQSVDKQSRLRYMSLPGCNPLDQMLALQMMQEYKTKWSVYTSTSTLYIGELSDEVIMMSPLLSFKDDQISQICLHNNFTVAMIFESKKYVSLYDLTDHTLQRIQMETDDSDKLVQSDDGFVVYNDKRCICLQRLTGPSLSTKYQIKEITFPDTKFYNKKIKFCGNTWYHYYHKRYEEEFKFECVSHSNLVSVGSMEDAVWKSLPLPKEASRCCSDTITDNIFQICVPKSKLRCDIECPHCKVAARRATSRALRVSRDDDSGDYFYDDSSDDDSYHWYGHSYNDDDCDYSFDSD